MSVVRIGATKKYSENWESIFSGGRAIAKSKTAKPVKKSAKKKSPKKAKKSAKKPARRK